MSQFEQWEITQAQSNLDIQPSNSPYWDSRSGQDDLQVIQALRLQAHTTEQERRRMHNDAMHAPIEEDEYIHLRALPERSCIECGEPTTNHNYCDACLAHHEDADRLSDEE